MRYAHITGWGAYVPPRIVTNEELGSLVETSDEWITERTGIKTRHIADADDHTSMMAIKAGREALGVANPRSGQARAGHLRHEHAGLPDAEHSQPDPGRPGREPRGRVDLNAACSSFVYALTVGSAMLRSGMCRNALVIGAEAMSRVMDWTDRSTRAVRRRRRGGGPRGATSRAA
ncbi:MAG: hypothetical protein U0470_06955 [Anaerolineae bacterium]